MSAFARLYSLWQKRFGKREQPLAKSEFLRPAALFLLLPFLVLRAAPRAGNALAIEQGEDQRTCGEREKGQQARHGGRIGALGKEKEEGVENEAGPEQHVGVSRENLSPQVKLVDCLLKISVLPANPGFADALQCRTLLVRRQLVKPDTVGFVRKGGDADYIADPT